MKKHMLGSMFPEKIEIFEGQYRTKRLNSAVAYILLRNKELREQKKDKIEKNRVYPV